MKLFINSILIEEFFVEDLLSIKIRSYIKDVIANQHLEVKSSEFDYLSNKMLLRESEFLQFKDYLKEYLVELTDEITPIMKTLLSLEENQLRIQSYNYDDLQFKFKTLLNFYIKIGYLKSSVNNSNIEFEFSYEDRERDNKEPNS